jgi:hypothetical protein
MTSPVENADDFVVFLEGALPIYTGPRLWSKAPRAPQDAVADEHREIHADLDRWGRWNREKYQKGTCASIEKNFDETGGRHVRAPVIALPPDPTLRRIEEIVVAMRSTAEQHSETLALYYCRRISPKNICWSMRLRYEDFARWMFDCRAMVLRALG